MKVAIAGKGGVGKTTLASLLARIYSAEGKRVIAIDANPDANLAQALGIPGEEARNITPIAELKELIEERTGARMGGLSPYFKLNPRVEDIPERFSAVKDNVWLLVLGTVKRGGVGCMCPESALLRSLLSHLLLGRDEIVIMDMDAGVEHLGRGTAQAVDAFIVVVEPGRRSLQTAEAVRELAKDLGIERCFVVGSKTRDEADRRFIQENLPQFELLGFLNYNPQIVEADRRGWSIFDSAPQAAKEVGEIKERLEKYLREEQLEEADH
jgi:CO dehydrogenase maturation factor